MQKEAKQEEQPLSAEIQDAMKSFVSSARIIKIYPPNNPVYAQSLKKSFEVLSSCLKTTAELIVGVQKTYFTCMQVPIGKDGQVNKAIAQDLFGKGIREIVFTAGLDETEFESFLLALALSTEELAMRNGISTILWEKGVAHIQVTEAGLDEVITSNAGGGWEKLGAQAGSFEDQKKSQQKDQTAFAGKTLVLGDLKKDPEGFGASMVEFALRTRVEHETIEDRLFTLYQQAGNKIQKDHAEESEELFQGLAKSVLALKPPYREAFIAGKLYESLDVDLAAEIADDQFIPTVADEVRTGRFSESWTVEQVAVLLKRSASKKTQPPVPPPKAENLKVMPISSDLAAIAASLTEESPEELEALKEISNAGMESDIIESAVKTLIGLVPLVKTGPREGNADRARNLFSGVMKQLEDILVYLLKNNNYTLATVIIKALHLPVAPQFQQRMSEALRKTATKSMIKSTITDMRKHLKSSPEYQSAYSYLSNLDQKAVEALLDLLADETDRESRIFLLELMKEFGKNQLALLGEHLTDERWYVVRNVVSILAENKSDQAIAMLRKAADHQNIQIRQEVVKALMATGGKKAAGVLGKFLRDPDAEMQMMAIRAFSEMPNVGPDEAKPVMEFLRECRLNRKEQDLAVAAIRTLGRFGGGDAALFLQPYTRIRWWRSRKLQNERRDAAIRSIEEITRRQGDV